MRQTKFDYQAGLLGLSLLIPICALPQSSAPAQPSPPQTAPATPQTPSAQQPELPNAPAPVQQPAPSSSPQQPSLSDLGFTPQQTQADPKLQARLNKRTEMLKIHQRLGLITLAPMAATLITGPMAKAKGHDGQTIREPSNANLDFHAAPRRHNRGPLFHNRLFRHLRPEDPR
jgi:hypothetical protein